MPFTELLRERGPRDGSRPPVWLAADESRPLMFFAGVWTRWTSVRKLKEGEVRADLFGSFRQGDLLVRKRMQIINGLSGHLAECGIIARRGLRI